MRRIIKASMEDRSSMERFQFSLRCAVCGSLWESQPVCFSKAGMQPESEGVDGTMTFVCTYTPSRSGIHVYGVRVMPCTEGLSSPLETRLVLWG